MNLPLHGMLAATNGTLIDSGALPASLRVSTDTRTIEPGDAFVALRGERFDGHDFAADAARRGAALLVLDRPDARVPGTAALVVADTKAAYISLAAEARRLFAGDVVAIAGSAGKTTTKALLAALLACRYADRVLASAANENNEIGVSKLFLNASNDAHAAIVVEMGARHYGDVAALVKVGRPHVGILTNIGDAHLEIMGSRERLEETKWGLFCAGAQAVLNAGDDASRRRAATLSAAPHWFAAYESAGAVPAALEPATVLVGERELLYRRAGRTARRAIDTRLPGLHNRANLAAAIAGALALGLAIDDLLPAIPALSLPPGRYDRIAAGGLELIYDAYNANAAGTIAALDAFASEAASRRIAVLASMAELGDEAGALHERVGAHAAARVDVLLVSGEHAAELARGARRGGLAASQIVAVATNAQAARWLREHARRDDVVLLKGSRKYRMEEIVEELRT